MDGYPIMLLYLFISFPFLAFQKNAFVKSVIKFRYEAKSSKGKAFGTPKSPSGLSHRNDQKSNHQISHTNYSYTYLYDLICVDLMQDFWFVF